MEEERKRAIDRLALLCEMKGVSEAHLSRINDQIIEQKRVLQLICEHEWRYDAGDEYGEKPTQSCRHCGSDR